MADPTCYEVVQELDPAMRTVLEDGQRYFVVGGTAGAALEHPDTHFDHDEGMTYAAPDSDKSIFREENGTRRDLDVLIDGVLSKEEKQAIHDVVEAATDEQLKISIFGFEPHVPTMSGMQRFLQGVTTFTSDRTIDQHGVRRIELFPIAQPVQDESFEPYTLVTPQGGTFPTFSPVGHVLAYRTRSITGLRD